MVKVTCLCHVWHFQSCCRRHRRCLLSLHQTLRSPWPTSHLTSRLLSWGRKQLLSQTSVSESASFLIAPPRHPLSHFMTSSGSQRLELGGVVCSQASPSKLKQLQTVCRQILVTELKLKILSFCWLFIEMLMFSENSSHMTLKTFCSWNRCFINSTQFWGLPFQPRIYSSGWQSCFSQQLLQHRRELDKSWKSAQLASLFKHCSAWLLMRCALQFYLICLTTFILFYFWFHSMNI